MIELLKSFMNYSFSSVCNRRWRIKSWTIILWEVPEGNRIYDADMWQGERNNRIYWKVQDCLINCTKIKEMKRTTKALSSECFGWWSTWNWKSVQIPLIGDVTTVPYILQSMDVQMNNGLMNWNWRWKFWSWSWE